MILSFQNGQKLCTIYTPRTILYIPLVQYYIYSSYNTIYTPRTILKDPNVKFSEINHIERVHNDVWIIQNEVGKIKHNETEFLYSLKLWIPEYPSIEKIVIQVSFTQDQEGKINDQILSIILV